NWYNFDFSHLDFIHGGSISITQTSRRPILSNPVPSDTPGWGSDFKDASLKYFNRSLSVGAQGASIPHRNNYLSLDEEYKDAYVNSMLKMSYYFNEQVSNHNKYFYVLSA